MLKYDPNETMKIKDKQWYLYVLLAILFVFIREGGLKITLEYSFNNTLVLLYAYVLACMSFSLKGVVMNGSRDTLLFSKSFSLGMIMGVFSFLGMFLYASALKSGPASVVAPLFSLRSLVIVGLSVLVFKERLSKFQIVAIGIIVIATIIISI